LGPWASRGTPHRQTHALKLDLKLAILHVPERLHDPQRGHRGTSATIFVQLLDGGVDLRTHGLGFLKWRTLMAF
jgi:hypothetical protein